MKFKFLAIFALLFLVACNDEFSRHHLTINSPDGIKTKYFAKDRRLQIGEQKPYLLFFFGADCGVCKTQIPILNKLRSELGEDFKFIAVLGPSKGFDKDMALLKQHNLEFKTTSDKASVDYFSKAVGGVMGVPAIFVFDKSGKMRRKFIGLTPKDALKSEISAILLEK